MVAVDAGLVLLGLMVWNVTMVQSRILHRAEKDFGRSRQKKYPPGWKASIGI
jgi:hypothetical protein